MRYLVRHRSSYQYTTPVVTSFHRLHLTPESNQWQSVNSHAIHVFHNEDHLTNEASEVKLYQDSFTNTCGRFDILYPYQSLHVESWTDISISEPSTTYGTHDWQITRDNPFYGGKEFLYDSLHIRRHPQLAAFAESYFQPGRLLRDVILDVTKKIYNECTYDSRATDLATPPMEVLQKRRGVCQDFAHLGIAALRSLGIPAAYVSGYLETQPPEGQSRLVGADASHAWFAVPDCDGNWIHADPTNGCLIGARHVTTAVGRDFADVSPVTGIIYGGGLQNLSVAVDVIPESEWNQTTVFTRFQHMRQQQQQ